MQAGRVSAKKSSALPVVDPGQSGTLHIYDIYSPVLNNPFHPYQVRHVNAVLLLSLVCLLPHIQWLATYPQ